jgi:hypothetical protein
MKTFYGCSQRAIRSLLIGKITSVKIAAFLVLLLAVCAFSTAEMPSDTESMRSNSIGLNVWFLNDWDGSFAFVDAMKHSRPWQDGSDWHNPVAGVDKLGWPMADASTVIYTGTPEQINGTYLLAFNGQAEVSLLWAQGSVTNKRYDSATNTTTANVIYAISEKGTVGLVFRSTRRTAQSGINTGFSNVRLYRPGYPADGSQVFTVPFLKALSKVGVVRMMDWTATNRNLTQRWSDRITPLSAAKAGPSYSGPGGQTWESSDLGVAIEHQIQLCNALRSDCWINIPVLADDDYVRKIAQALRYGTDGTNPYASVQSKPAYPPLDPSLKVYIEYANEVWNSSGGFDCFGVVKDFVSSLPDDHEVFKPEEENRWYWVWRYPAYRIAIVSDIFRSIFGDTAMMSRVRPVLMTQQGDGQATLSQALLWLDSYARRQSPSREPRSYLYGAGGSAYYSVNKEPRNQSDTNAFFAPGNYPAKQSVRNFGIDAVWAMNYGLKRIAYEGGPGLDSYSETNANRINLDPRMQDLVVKTHEAWSNQGGDLLVYYALRGPYQWEFTPDLADTATPKFKGIAELLSHPRAPVTLGAKLPGSVVAVDQADYRARSGYDYAVKVDGLPCIGGNDSGEWIALPCHSEADFEGRLTVNGAAGSPTTIAVWVNGAPKGKVVLPKSDSLVDSSSLSVSIPSGLVVIRLEVLSGGFQLRSFTIKLY